MTIPKIALFGPHRNRQLAAVEKAVQEEGGDPLLFDLQLGGEQQPTVTLGERCLQWQGVDFKSIQAVFIRGLSPNTLPALPPMLNQAEWCQWRHGYLKEQQYHSVTASFFAYLKDRGVLVINPITNGYVEHDAKAWLYEKLRANGFLVPHTLSTNNPEKAKIFLRQHGEAVIKPSIGVGSTRMVTLKDQNHLQDLKISPVMMQERIYGNTIRVHIVGDSVVLALKILSDGGVDSRTQTKEFEYIELPPEACQRIVRANRSLGLHFAAWDIMETKKGDYVYLDCNPGPYVMWIGPLFVQAVFRQLARYMISFAQTQSLKTASNQVTPWRG